MSVTIGIDVGGSTTKIVGFGEDGVLIRPMFVKAADPATSVYGAFGKFTSDNGLGLSDIRRVMITGVGSTCIKDSIYGLSCTHVQEFECVATGGIYLSGLERAVIVSMGTGTSTTYGEKITGDMSIEYLGGTGVGGGTLTGLARKLLGIGSINSVVELAESGDVGKTDLRVMDITRKAILPGLPSSMTAANFGKVDDFASPSDIAAGLINMVLETVAMTAIFAARTKNVTDIVMTGNLTAMPQAKVKFDEMSEMFSVKFIIPENSRFATVIGAALLERKAE